MKNKLNLVAMVGGAATTLFFAFKLYQHKKQVAIDNDNNELRTRSYAGKKLVVLPHAIFKQPLLPEKQIIFVHISKVGGTNICHVVAAVNKIRPDFTFARFVVPRIPNQSPSRIYKNWRGSFVDAEKKLSEDPAYCANYSFISGHFPFGLHSMASLDAKYIVLVRNPIERELSTLNYDGQRGYINTEGAEEYMLGEECLDNPQARMLAGQQFMQGKCDENTLLQAKNNIEQHFMLAGVTEETNEFIAILASLQGWGRLGLSKAQVSGDKIFELNSVPAEIKQRLQLKHKFDMELYTWVKKRWQQWKADHVSHYVTLSSEPIFCLKPEFATTKTPEIMNQSEVDAYNAGVDDDLVQITAKAGTSAARRSCTIM